jgi:3-hydroxyisobutyrate dehydrogenase-like beta-hydroxyacid dehydrogenase
MGVCESLLYGYKAGLDLNLVIDTISTGAGNFYYIINKLND